MSGLFFRGLKCPRCGSPDQFPLSRDEPDDSAIVCDGCGEVSTLAEFKEQALPPFLARALRRNLSEA